MKTILIPILAVTVLTSSKCKNTPKNSESYPQAVTATPPTPAGSVEQNIAYDTTRKNTEEAPKPKQEQPMQPGNQNHSQTGQKTGNNYDLTASFYSIGEGTDAATMEKFIQFLDTYRDKITINKTPWGREGEIDYCINLTNLEENAKSEFLKKAKGILAASKLVHVNENAPCRNKR